jgi:hypothetical protein
MAGFETAAPDLKPLLGADDLATSSARHRGRCDLPAIVFIARLIPVLREPPM